MQFSGGALAEADAGAILYRVGQRLVLIFCIHIKVYAVLDLYEWRLVNGEIKSFKKVARA